MSSIDKVNIFSFIPSSSSTEEEEETSPPLEVVLRIFSFFSDKNLSDSRLVCKRWKQIIDTNTTLLMNQYIFYVTEATGLASDDLDIAYNFLTKELTLKDFDKALEWAKKIKGYQLGSALERLVEEANTKEKICKLNEVIFSSKPLLDEYDFLKLGKGLISKGFPKLTTDERISYLEKTRSFGNLHLFVALTLFEKFPLMTEEQATNLSTALNVSTESFKFNETHSLVESFSFISILSLFKSANLLFENSNRISSFISKISSREEATQLIEAVKSDKKKAESFLYRDEVFNQLHFLDLLEYAKLIDESLPRQQFIYHQLVKTEVTSAEDFKKCIEFLIAEPKLLPAVVDCAIEATPTSHLTESIYDLLEPRISVEEMPKAYMKLALVCESKQSFICEKLKKMEEIDESILMEIFKLELKTKNVELATKTASLFKDEKKQIDSLKAIAKYYVRHESWDLVISILNQLNSRFLSGPYQEKAEFVCVSIMGKITKTNPEKALELSKRFNGKLSLYMLFQIAETLKELKKDLFFVISEIRNLVFALASKNEITRDFFLHYLKHCLELQR